MSWKVYPIPPGPGRRSWRLQARPIGGGKSDWRNTKTADEAEARALASAWQAVLDEELAEIALERDPTVGDVVSRRIAEGFAREGTAIGYRTALRRLERVGVAGVRASQLSRSQVLLAQDKLRALPLSPGSVNLTLSRAAAAWNWALERELVAVAWPKVRRLKSQATPKRPFSDLEVVRVLDWARTNKPTWLPMLQVLADAGCRPGELVAIDGRDVDRAGLMITMRHTKTGAVRRVALPAETIALLPQVGPDQPVFLGQRGRSNTMGVYYRLGVALKALGLDDEDLDVASFRRAWVSTAHRAGIPMDIARRQTGHEHSGIHAGYMRNARGDDLHAAVEAVAAQRQKARALSAEGRAGKQPVDPSFRGDQWFQEDPPEGGRGNGIGRDRQMTQGSQVAAGCLTRLRDLLPIHPFGEALARWSAEGGGLAMMSLLCDPVTQLALREALLEQGVEPYRLSSLPASRSSSRTRSGG